MKTILVANSKGGSGKTMTAITLAGAIRASGARVTLADADPQRSARTWATRRSPYAARIQCVKWVSGDAPEFVPAKTEWLVIDSAAGLSGAQASAMIGLTNYLVTPVMASVFDELAARKFLRNLSTIKRLKKGKVEVLPIASRADLRRKDTAALAEFMEANGFPLVATISERAAYVELAREGLSVFDRTQAPYRKMQAQWAPLLGRLGIQ